MSRVVETRPLRRTSAARCPAPPVSRSDRVPPPPPSPSEMHAESARLLSFSEGWPESSPVRPADLARAGLYRVGPDDLVACFRCGGAMRRWKAGDDTVREHARHFPACAVKAPLPPATQDGARSTLSPKMHSFRARSKSFASWPNTANVSPQELANAGFYYSGHGDLVRCFSCDGHLQEWELGDSAWHEHAKWFPSCAFLTRWKGEAFVREATRPPAQLPRQTPLSTGERLEPASPSAEELLNKLEERLSCKVCMEHEVSVIFTPCRHVVTCGHCALSLSECPVCRVAVRRALRAFMA
ncbi:baculoviral IAP repeat-containing protein 7-B-like [Lampetra fluviatilis]